MLAKLGVAASGGRRLLVSYGPLAMLQARRLNLALFSLYNERLGHSDQPCSPPTAVDAPHEERRRRGLTFNTQPVQSFKRATPLAWRAR